MTAPDVAAARDAALTAIHEEKETHALALDNLAATVRGACEAFTAGDVQASHVSIARALDLAHELLGTCEPLEPLAAILGFEDPEPALTAAPSTLVVLEVMPNHLRESHREARNWGSYPHNGAQRYAATPEEAERIVREDAAGDGYDHIVESADPAEYPDWTGEVFS